MENNGTFITVSAGQFDVKVFESEKNIETMKKLAAKARTEDNSNLIVFPEAAVSGYCFNNLDEVESVAQTENGSAVTEMKRTAMSLGIYIVFGMVENDKGKLYNTQFFIKPDGSFTKYRKSHLPVLGLDRFVERGTSLEVSDTEFGKMAGMICYDLRYPEVCRVLALKGARLIFQSTNLPEGGESHPEIFTRARACENKVFIVSCNRTGYERGTHFIGRSQIIDTYGAVLREMTSDEEGIISARINLQDASEKDIIFEPGVHELRLFTERHPELYKEMTELERK